MIRLFVPDALHAGARVQPPPEQAHYLVNVMRLGPGAEVHLFNGREGEWRATVAEASKRGVALVVAAQTRPLRLPGLVPTTFLLCIVLKLPRLSVSTD